MKNLLTYINPNKDFNKEHQKLAKIQIDNSLSLGWKPENIILVTNFPYEYNGIKSVVIGDENYCKYHWSATKIYAIVSLFKAGLIEKDLYWYHDFDCFQLNPFTEIETELEKADMGITQYSRMLRLCSASMFFKETAWDIFIRLKDFIDKGRIDEELGIMRLINTDKGNLKERVKKIDITYAFHKFNLLSCYKIAKKPIKAVHFHLTPDKAEFYIHGKNKLNIPLIPERLIKIFAKYDFR